MSDIYRSSVERRSRYEDRAGDRTRPPVERVAPAASPAFTVLTLAAVLIGGMLVAIAAVRCAADDAVREDPAPAAHHGAADVSVSALSSRLAESARAGMLGAWRGLS